MDRGSAKHEMLDVIQQLPDDATFEEAMVRLYFLGKVHRGLDDAKAGREVPHDEIRGRHG